MRVKLLVALIGLAAGLAVLGAAPVVAQDADGGNLTVDVVQDTDGTATVTVTHNDTAVSNASVNVTVLDDNVTYDGAGDYETDDNGTVDLPAPNETVNVSVAAEGDNMTGSTTATLEPADAFDTLSLGVQQGAGQVTVTVTEAGDVVENATVSVDSANWTVNDTTTDENGVATFDRPTETVNATITAETADATGSTNVTIEGAEGEGPDFTPHGQMVSSLVHSLLNDNSTEDPLGLLLQSIGFVGGPPDHAGPPDDGDSDNETAGPPDDAGPDGDRGPPDHAGPGGDDDGDDEDGDEEAAEDDEEDDGGPPDHAGPP